VSPPFDVHLVHPWSQPYIITRLAVALAIGLLVGLERGWPTRDEEEQRTAEFRTFALSGLRGGIKPIALSELILLGLAYDNGGKPIVYLGREANGQLHFAGTAFLTLSRQPRTDLLFEKKPLVSPPSGSQRHGHLNG
jgi:hypothetical protein